MWKEPNFNFCTTTIIIEEADNVFLILKIFLKITNMIKCLNMKKNLFEKNSAQKMHYKISKHVYWWDKWSNVRNPIFFVFFNVFPRFKNRNNPMVCMLIFIFTFFLHEPKKFCALYTNIVININSRVQTLIYCEKVNSSFWKAGTTVFVSLLYHKIF